jgi:hypothetical protein
VILIRSDMPEGALGLEALGQVTADDYRDVIAPALERRAPDQPIRLLLLADERFESVAAGAVLQDVKLWLDRLGDWNKIAVVTDHDWITNTVGQFSWLGSGTIRVFPVAEVDVAKAWLARDDA